MKVLILADEHDLHGQAVAGNLREQGVAVDFFQFDDFLQFFNFEFRIKNTESSSALQHMLSGQKLHLEEYFSIWHRRPGRIVVPHFDLPWIGELVSTEAKYTLNGVLSSLPCLWVNYPPNDSQCLHKLFQLEAARQAGLTLPETLVTNNKEAATAFYSECDGRVVYKLIAEASNFSLPIYEMPAGVPTLPMRDVDVAFLDQVRFGPHLFQKRVDKVSDIRVTVIGKKAFAINIDSQKGVGQLDWRHDYSVAMTQIELPKIIEEQCLLLVKKLGLNYGAIDFCVTKDGEYVFLEINCAGQYLWIEERTDLKLSWELAQLLSGNSEPLTLPSNSRFCST